MPCRLYAGLIGELKKRKETAMKKPLTITVGAMALAGAFVVHDDVTASVTIPVTGLAASLGMPVQADNWKPAK
jgi:hypothetical protein